ncbi:helix-turn-helix transcriptional regulator [Falsihalocynthiibacter sp. BN13B15]|uniref:helix-turn-helix transcriptional regulator n=1 Tax=Falsihalocynthiibacter sp. BN13B15 TaxID=3240871 RepID=UPI00350EFC07
MKKLVLNTSDTLERIYDSALRNTLLETILDVVSHFLPGTAVVLFGQDTVRLPGNFMLHKGLGTNAVVASMANLAVDNPWFERQWHQRLGEIYQDAELMSREEQIASRGLTIWNATMGVMVHASGIVLHRQRTRQLVLEIRFPETTDAKSRRDATALLETLGPHLVRAAKIMYLKSRFPLSTQMANDVLELFPFPVLIVDTECRVRSMNERAELLANRMDTFFISADSIFHATNLDAELEFRAMVNRMGAGVQHSTELFSLPNAEKSQQIFLSLTKLGANSTQRLNSRNVYEKQGARLALIIQDTTEALKLSHSALWNAFKLTNAEAELASLLLEGCTIGDCAQKQSLAKQTLRNHLGSIMKKTKTNRQPQLVALLTRLALTTTL